MSGPPSFNTTHDSYRQERHTSVNPGFSTISSFAAPMAIPRARDAVPPPLPPPSYIPDIIRGHDLGWQWGNDPDASDFGRAAALTPGSSLLGGSSFGGFTRQEQEHEHFETAPDVRRGSSISTITADRARGMSDTGTVRGDEDAMSSSAARSNYSLHGERQLRERTLEASSTSYDKQLLSRIGGPSGPNTPKRPSLSCAAGSSSLQDTSAAGLSESERRNGYLLPLSMPDERRQTSLDSPASSRRPGSAALSPGFTGPTFWAEHGPPERSLSRSQTRHGSLNFDDSVSQRGSYDQAMFAHEEFVADGRMGGLNLYDRSPGSDEYRTDARPGGVKRRASSPPREALRDDRISISSASGQSEILPRRSVHPPRCRGSPVSRLYHPSHSSLSSVSSLGIRNGSLGSSLGVSSVPSSATSYGSERVSPSGLSPAYEQGESRAESFHPASQSVTHAPSSMRPRHSRAYSSASQPGAPSVSADSSTHSRNSSVSQSHCTVFMCECCPKKPKKFDTREDLRVHESEKQYTCLYCPNRFKNKNEAERHQNSLHLRLHSWSCAALAGVEAAFHASQTSHADVCGYCGEEFSNPPQWDMRAEHLNHVHKFGECNQAKKFFRADHFRQHLKHSHAGTSGKWTNMLENACMKDEPLPEKRVAAGTVQNMHPALPALVVPDISTSQYGSLGLISERPHDRE